jgi:SulP family sulfate permease
MRNEYVPKLFSVLKEGISREQLSKDIISGIIVGIVALPLAIAFAIASGVSPEKGLITAIVAGLIISAFGGSRVQIGGPTGAFIVIVFGILSQYGLDGLIISTFMAGLILVGLGLLKFGNYLKFIPYPLVVGFTSGIALIIFSSQINDFFGLSISNLPADFIEKWQVYLREFSRINFLAFGIAVGTVILTLYFHKIVKLIPGSLLAILLSSIIVSFFEMPVDTIGSRFGNIPNSLNIPPFPDFDMTKIRQLIQPAFTIAFLGAIESILSAVVADGMIGGKHRPNMELIAQGGANVFSSIFGGIPATGAIARTATNVKNGGRTPIAGMVHAVTLLLVMLVFAPYAKLIPLSCLAGILVVVAYNMSEWRQFSSILKSKSADIAILLTTFLLTVIFDLIVAIEVGLILSGFLFMKRMSESIEIRQIYLNSEDDKTDKLFSEEINYETSKVLLFEINGPLFFGAAQQFQESLINTNTKPKFVIIRLRYVPFIDTTGFQRLKEIIKTFHVGGTTVILSGVSDELKKEFELNSLYSLVSKERVFKEINEAIEWVNKQAVQ